VSTISTYIGKLAVFSDPIERLANAFGRLADSMTIMKASISGLAELPLQAIIESFNKFSPTEEALVKIERLSVALEKVGREYQKSMDKETKIAAELSTGKVTTQTNPAVQKDEDLAKTTNKLLGDSKEVLDKILEAVMPQDKPKFTNFGASLFGSPRGFEM